MTGGGLYILVAYGSQNVILSGNPDFTYFYLVLKKYSHFSFESVTLPLEGPQELFYSEPIKLRAKIQRVADLLSDLYLTFTLPDIYSKYTNNQDIRQYEFQWVRNIGAQIIQDASFFVGGSLIQQFDSDYLISMANIDQDETQYMKWRSLVGDVPELYDPANGQYSGGLGNGLRQRGIYPNVVPSGNPGSTQSNFPSIPSRDITVPLSFWFSQAPSLALPLVSLQYHECEVQLTLRPIQDLYTILDPSGNRVRPENHMVSSGPGVQSGNVAYSSYVDQNGTYINQYLTDIGYAIPAMNTWPLNARLQATYIYLTDNERNTFASKPLNYLVRQVTRYSFPSISSRQFFELFTHNPVPRVIVIPRRSDSIQYRNDWMNYTNWYNPPVGPWVPGTYRPIEGSSGLLVQGIQKDILQQIRVLCDGNEVQETKNIQYFNELSSWKYTAGISPTGLSIYSFSLNSSAWMKPSGTLNTSRVKKFQIDLNPWPLPVDSNYLIDYVIYVESLNFFIVEGGMGGMKWAT